MDFGASWGPPGHLLGPLGASLGRLGGILARLGGVLGRLESVLARLGVLGGILGRLGGVLGSKNPPKINPPASREVRRGTTPPPDLPLSKDIYPAEPTSTQRPAPRRLAKALPVTCLGK